MSSLRYFVAAFVVIICFVFIIIFFLVKNMFNNDYIIDGIINGRYYSQKLLSLQNDDSLNQELFELFSTYNKEGYIFPIFFNNLPKTLINEKNIDHRKLIFINIVLPLIWKVQASVQQDRLALLFIISRILSNPISTDDFLKIKQLSKKYDIEVSNDNDDYSLVLEELLKRVDIIPISLVLAQAIKESGWGMSRFAIEGNALFAEWTWNKKIGILPAERGEEQKHFIRKFSSLLKSVESYYNNLNTHDAYKKFRELRANQRTRLSSEQFLLDSYTDGIIQHNYILNQLDDQLDPIPLIYSLLAYSGQDANYSTDLIQIVRNNNLTRYDTLKGFDDTLQSFYLKVK